MGRDVDAGTATARGTRSIRVSSRASPDPSPDRRRRRRVARRRRADRYLRRAGCSGRSSVHDRSGAAPGPCPARIVDRDPGPPPQRRAVGERRAPSPGRNPGRNALRDARPARQPVRQGLDPLRPAALVRPAARGAARERRQCHRETEGRRHDPRPRPADRRRRRRDDRADRRDAEPARDPEPAARRRGSARGGRSPHADRGVVGARPPGLAGHRRVEPEHRAAGGPSWLARSRRAADRRRRDRRDRQPRRVPRRHPSLPTHVDRRCRPRLPPVAAWYAAEGGNGRPGDGRRPRPRPRPRGVG